MTLKEMGRNMSPGKVNREEIISGLQFIIDMVLFDPLTGDVCKYDQLNEDNRYTVKTCYEAIQLLRQCSCNKKEVKADADSN